MPTFVPDGFRRTIVALRGEAGAEWLDRLPEIVARCEEHWSLKAGPSFPNLSYNYAAPGVLADGTAVVLKLSFPDDREFRTETAALALFDGRGAVQLLGLNPGLGAMLLERAQPGVPLDTVKDDREATSIAANVMREMWRPAPSDHSFPTVSDWARGFERLRRRFGGGTGPMPAALVGEAESLFAELIPSQSEPVLLHGDLHHANILSARRRSWLAIDPKGVVGEPAYDAGALLRNPVELLRAPHPGKVLERRLRQLSEELVLDPARVRGWAVAQAVLAAYWGLEDSGQVWKEALVFARLLAGVKAL